MRIATEEVKSCAASANVIQCSTVRNANVVSRICLIRAKEVLETFLRALSNKNIFFLRFFKIILSLNLVRAKAKSKAQKLYAVIKEDATVANAFV